MILTVCNESLLVLTKWWRNWSIFFIKDTILLLTYPMLLKMAIMNCLKESLQENWMSPWHYNFVQDGPSKPTSNESNSWPFEDYASRTSTIPQDMVMGQVYTFGSYSEDSNVKFLKDLNEEYLSAGTGVSISFCVLHSHEIEFDCILC